MLLAHFLSSGARSEYLVCSENGIGHGVKKGYLAATGVFIGDAVLMFLAWAGVAALIQTTPVLFNIVRYLGAFYLLWLGGKMLWSVITRQNNAHESGTEPASMIMKRRWY
jgi:leucine efflux protein